MSQVDAEPFVFTRSARSLGAGVIVTAWFFACFSLYFLLNAHPVIAAGLSIFALPALIDLLRGSLSSLQIDAREIRWSSGGRGGQMPRGQLKSVRLDTRLDFSLRMTLQTHQGEKLRLPYECVPPAKELAAVLRAHDIAVERHHFALMG